MRDGIDHGTGDECLQTGDDTYAMRQRHPWPCCTRRVNAVNGGAGSQAFVATNAPLPVPFP